MPVEAIAGVGGGILGAIAGSQKDVSTNSSTSWTDVGAESELEKLLGGRLKSDFSGLAEMVDAGPGVDDIKNSNIASRDLAALLKSYSETGGLPTDSDVTNANKFANSIFAAREEAMNQDFVNQTTDANRMAAAMGREINDPILQAKLRNNLFNQRALLGKEKQGYAAELGLGMADRRINYANQGANILGNLAYQAMQNRAAILGLGQNLQGSERQWRLETGKRYGTQEQSSGGGLKGGIEGFLGGAGMGFKAASIFGGNTSTGTTSGASMGGSNGFKSMLGNGNYSFT